MLTNSRGWKKSVREVKLFAAKWQAACSFGARGIGSLSPGTSRERGILLLNVVDYSIPTRVVGRSEGLSR